MNVMKENGRAEFCQNAYYLNGDTCSPNIGTTGYYHWKSDDFLRDIHYGPSYCNSWGPPVNHYNYYTHSEHGTSFEGDDYYNNIFYY